MSQSKIKSIRADCETFCRIRKRPDLLDSLVKFATRDYLATPKNKRHLWEFKKMKV